MANGRRLNSPYITTTTIDYITIASEGNAIDFGDTANSVAQIKNGASTATRGVFAGGTTDGSDASAFVTRSVEVTGLRWNTTGQITLLFAGGTATQDIAHLAGNGVWDETNHFYPVGMGAAAGGATLGDITIAAVAAAANHCTVQVVVKKLNGYDTPNYEGNAMLGYNAYSAGNFM